MQCTRWCSLVCPIPSTWAHTMNIEYPKLLPDVRHGRLHIATTNTATKLSTLQPSIPFSELAKQAGAQSYYRQENEIMESIKRA
jgi:hypothetical protein